MRKKFGYKLVDPKGEISSTGFKLKTGFVKNVDSQNKSLWSLRSLTTRSPQNSNHQAK